MSVDDPVFLDVYIASLQGLCSQHEILHAEPKWVAERAMALATAALRCIQLKKGSE